MNISTKILTTALMAATVPWLVVPAAAAPMSSPLGLQNAVAPSIETVQYRRGGYYRGGSYRGGYYRHGGVVGAGLGLAGAGLGLAGAIVGGAIVGATQPDGYYRYNSGYAYAPDYVDPYVDSSQVDYCQQRFRSYDQASGTYLGFDGLRHSCP